MVGEGVRRREIAGVGSAWRQAVRRPQDSCKGRQVGRNYRMATGGVEELSAGNGGRKWRCRSTRLQAKVVKEREA